MQLQGAINQGTAYASHSNRRHVKSLWSARCVVALLLVVLLQLSVPTHAQNGGMYCDPDDCYRVLGLYRYDFPTAKDIRKAYRKLSKELHPDRNLNNPDATEAFARVGRAYETLIDEDTRKDYDYYMDHPEDVMRNRYRYYTHVYAPKSDWRVVIAGWAIGISVLQWILQSYMHKRAHEQVMKSERFMKEVKRVAKERLSAASQNTAAGQGVSSKADRRKRKQAAKEESAELEQLEKDVSVELANEVQIEGGYSKPTIQGLLLVKLVKLPYTLPSAIWFQLDWYIRHSIRGEPLSFEEKMYLLTQALGVQEGALDQEYSPEEKQRLIDMECWHRDNFQRFQELQFKEKYPERYKQYMRWKRSNPDSATN